MINENDIQKLQSLIDNAHRIVFFGGAGVSTESGIPDFRSVDGLYSQHYKFPPEYMLSHDCFIEKQADFFDFYRDKLISKSASPNAAHKKVAELEKAGKLSAVITQNIDGLHFDAGSQRVYELHGSVRRNFCYHCGKFYDLEYIKNTVGVPKCECGGTIKPDVVLYGEQLDDDTVEGATNALLRADLLIIAGTSLTVYPASALIDYFRGDNIVVINLGATDKVTRATLTIDAKVGEVLSQIKVNR